MAFAPLEHKGAGPAIPERLFDGDDNVCVDFRYSQDPRLNWWFDHHVSAFQPPGDEAHFRADTSGQKFYDPDRARAAPASWPGRWPTKFGFDTAPVAELIEWAEIIDGALFPTAQMPVELKEPALRLMTWIENNRSDRAGGAVHRGPGVQAAGRDRRRAVRRRAAGAHPGAAPAATSRPSVKRVARMDGDVVITDFLDEKDGGLNKFIVYYLFPDARYSVTLLNVGNKMKIGVGSNPWSPVPRTHNIAAICERYGGGGHPVVGAISVPGTDTAAARKIASEVIATLKS